MTPLHDGTLEAAARKVESYKMVSADASATVNTVNRIYDELAAAIRALASPSSKDKEAASPTSGEVVCVSRWRLEAWRDYWNGLENPGAMSDALHHLVGQIESTLAAAPAASPVQGVDEVILRAAADKIYGLFSSHLDRHDSHALACSLAAAGLLTATPQAPSTVDERVRDKTISDFSDAELREELHRRAMEFLGDQRIGVGIAAINLDGGKS